MDTNQTEKHSKTNIFNTWIIIIMTLLIGWLIGSGNLDAIIQQYLITRPC